MTTEMDVLERLQETIIDCLVEPETVFDRNNVLIDYPDPDSMRKDTMVYIQPDYGNYEELTTASDAATFDATVFFVCKGAPSEKLVKRVFSCFSAFYGMLRSDNTLGGFIDSSRITDMDYYPSLTASRTMTAIEAKVELQWERRFNTRR